MYYYLSFVKHIKDNTEARELLRMDTETSAKATMHTKMGSAMNDPNCAYCFAIVTNDLGQVLKQDSYTAPVEQAETEA